MAKAKLPPVFELKGHLYARLYSPADVEPNICFHDTEAKEPSGPFLDAGYVFLKSISVEISLGEFEDYDVVGAQVRAMRREVDKVRAEMQNKITLMVAEIQKFEALVWNGETTA